MIELRIRIGEEGGKIGLRFFSAEDPRGGVAVAMIQTRVKSSKAET